MIPKIQEAVNYGLQVLETAFEQLDIKAGNSDSEEEEVNEKIELILEPKVSLITWLRTCGWHHGCFEIINRSAPLVILQLQELLSSQR